MSSISRPPLLVLSIAFSVVIGTAAVAAIGRPTPLAAATSSVVAGPPWISIEYPANPFDRTTRGAHLLVHAFYHGTPTNYPVSGSAEGIVNGDRRTITLRFETTSRTGVYALRKQWPADGSWTLVISVTQGEHERTGVAQALVELSPTGVVTSVRVPTQQYAEGAFPRRFSREEIESAVRANAQRVALAGRSRN